jgi:hypothetical protein
MSNIRSGGKRQRVPRSRAATCHELITQLLETDNPADPKFDPIQEALHSLQPADEEQRKFLAEMSEIAQRVKNRRK